MYVELYNTQDPDFGEGLHVYIYCDENSGNVVLRVEASYECGYCCECAEIPVKDFLPLLVARMRFDDAQA